MNRTVAITLALVIVTLPPSTVMAQEADDPRIAELTAQLAERDATIAALVEENGALVASNESLTAANEALRAQNARRGWALVNRLRGQVRALKVQMRKLQPRFQTNAQRWALMENTFLWMEPGCVGGWDYNTSTSTSGSYTMYSFSRWSSC